MKRVLWISAAVVVLDQATKATVLRFMRPEQSIPILGDWLRLTFTENPGMAFGITIGPAGTITVLALIATVLVAAYIYQVRNDYAPYRWGLALILGGALGNIIDRVFYGVLLDYGSFFTGHVVDFIHVSLWQGFIPQSVPILGGSYLELFPIWNVADMSIVLGVIGVLLFHQTFHERRRAKRRRAVQRRMPRIRRARRSPASVFSDLGRDLGTPPEVPSALSEIGRHGRTNGARRQDDPEARSTSFWRVQEEHM
jgi:signal peptidase II